MDYWLQEKITAIQRTTDVKASKSLGGGSTSEGKKPIYEIITLPVIGKRGKPRPGTQKCPGRGGKERRDRERLLGGGGGGGVIFWQARPHRGEVSRMWGGDTLRGVDFLSICIMSNWCGSWHGGRENKLDRGRRKKG